VTCLPFPAGWTILTITTFFDQNYNPTVTTSLWVLVGLGLINIVALWIRFKISLTKARSKVVAASARYDGVWKEFWERDDNLEYAQELARETKQCAAALDELSTRLMQEDAEAIWSPANVHLWCWLFLLDIYSESRRRAMYHGMRVSKAGKILQQTDNIDQLFAQAREIHWFFQDWVSKWDLNAQHIPGPVKNPARALQKCVRRYDREVRCLTDLVRCTIVAKDIKGALDFYKQVRRRCKEPSEGWPGMSTRNRGRSKTSLESQHDTDAKEIKVLKLTKIRNRLDPDYNVEESVGFRALTLGVEVCWIRHEKGVTFLPICKWGASGSQKHICEIQIVVEATPNGQDPEFYGYYLEWRDLMFT
jgi:hypothetical protein